RSLAAEHLDEPRSLGLALAPRLERLLAAALLLDVDEHEPDTDDEHDIGHVEHRPLVALVVPQDEVGHDPEIDAIDQVADGAAGPPRDEREPTVQEALLGPRLAEHQNHPDPRRDADDRQTDPRALLAREQPERRARVHRQPPVPEPAEHRHCLTMAYRIAIAL